jgi:diaminopimelate decarboxylase
LNGGKNVAFPTWYEYHELLPAARMHAPQAGRYNFYGPLCHPGDVLFVQKPFPRPEIGDVVAIMDSGAYFVPNQMNFSNPRAAAVMVSDGRAELIRSRETFEDVVRLDPVAASDDPAAGVAEGNQRRVAATRRRRATLDPRPTASPYP